MLRTQEEPQMSDSANVKQQVSDAGWQARVDLAAAYRLVAHFHWDDLVFTHISSRVPGEDGHFLINPYGWLFDEITASSLIKIDLHGRQVMDSPISAERRVRKECFRTCITRLAPNNSQHNTSHTNY